MIRAEMGSGIVSSMKKSRPHHRGMRRLHTISSCEDADGGHGEQQARRPEEPPHDRQLHHGAQDHGGEQPCTPTR
ncbi:MAG: hypothetical protein R2746_18390 [Acidimicrobiales bacterium]